MAIGRPPTYRDDFCAQVIELGKDGATKAQMARHFGVARKTLYAWARDHESFGNALEEAMDHAQAWWEDQGKQGIWAGSQFNANVWKFNMANRFREDYAERRQHEVSGPEGAPVQVQRIELVAPDDE